MRKRIQIFISFILFLVFLSVILKNITFRIVENQRNVYEEVNSVIQKDNNTENTDITDITENTKVYIEFLKNYKAQGEEIYYSFIELVGYNTPILLLSDDIYKDENSRNIALCTDVYYRVNNRVTRFGNICSNGTAYPISADMTGIYTAGGHEVTKYSLDIPNHKLKLLQKYIMVFHKTGDDEVKAITIGIIGDKNKIVSEEEFNKAYKNYANGEIIYFSPFVNNK